MNEKITASIPVTAATVTDPDACNLDDFRSVVEQTTNLADYPLASAIANNAVVYEAAALRRQLGDAATETAACQELASALDTGPGIVVISGAIEAESVDAATEAFFAIIAEEKAQGLETGDHYAKPGANDRVWNALEKLAVAEPETFVDYYRNDIIALAARAWLGPGYQLTSQINVVNPGGAAQRPHRDYHLGFMTNERAAQYPLHTHLVSPALTLQGAIAHCDMPVESGPTMYLPYSHRYALGYLAWRRPEFIDYFDINHVQVPLAKGDAVFFNPALFHGAGTNQTSDIRRIANLFQINSPLGRVMETVDNRRVVNAVYPAMLARYQQMIAGWGAGEDVGSGDDRDASAAESDPVETEVAWTREFEDLVAACADGYAFPTNLDRDPPLGGLTPPSQADLVRHALQARTSPEELAALLDAHAERRRTH